MGLFISSSFLVYPVKSKNHLDSIQFGSFFYFFCFISFSIVKASIDFYTFSEVVDGECSRLL